MISYHRFLDAAREHGCAVREGRRGHAMVQCTAAGHDDGNPSLSVTYTDGRILLYCFAGCTPDDVVTGAGLALRDLFDEPRGRTYTYPGGRIVNRSPGKRFWQSGNKQDRSLYGADRIGDADVVFVVEGEQDVDSIISQGGAAVSPAQGAGKADRHDWNALQGRHVRIIADKDETGLAHAYRVRDHVHGIARSVVVLLAAIGKDASDHIAAGLPLEAFIAAPQPSPPSNESDDSAAVDPDLEFWSQTAELKHVYDFARARRASPAAVLAGVLRRATSSVEPHVVLPATIGGETSVNLFTVAAGASGEGKGAAEAAAANAVFFHDANAESLDAARPSIGTGEGLARIFSGGKGQDPVTRANANVPEVKTLEALMGRQGATLEGELLKAYMGEALGFQNAQKDTTTAVEPQSYRLCLGVGCQPENAGFFLSREKDGFPQRFFWTAVHDAHAPAERPDPVSPLVVLVPHFAPNRDDGRHVLALPVSVTGEIDAFRHRVLTRAAGVDPLDGHLMLTRLKLTFALAVLHGRPDLREDHWKIAGDLVEMSVAVRTGMRRAVEEARRRANRAKGREQGERAQIVAESEEERMRKRVGQAIVRKLRRDGHATRRELRVACAQSIRGEFDGVFELFVEQGLIVESGDDGNGFAARYGIGSEYEGGV